MTDEPTPLQAKRLDRLAVRTKQRPQHRQEQLMGDLELQVYTVNEAADLLEMNDQTVRRWCRDGELQAAKMGRNYRISRRALADFWKDRGGGELFDDD